MSSQAIVWTPLRRDISAITNATNAVVTTTVDHGYIDNQWIRLFVPLAYGMELNFVQTKITILSSTQFQTDLNTSNLLPFVVPVAPPAFTGAQAVPISGVEDNTGIA